MSTKRRAGGEGSIDQRGPDTWRIRYRIDGKRFAATVHGTKALAQRELRRLLREGDTGEHVEPTRRTLAQWAAEWLALLGRGTVSARTREGYANLLRLHALPELGGRRLQQITTSTSFMASSKPACRPRTFAMFISLCGLALGRPCARSISASIRQPPPTFQR